jgi:ABC-type uncharacterized transport system permease subunit
MVLVRVEGCRPTLGHGGGARNLPTAATTSAAARATTCNMGRSGGATASAVHAANDTTAIRATDAVRISASTVRAASGGLCLGAIALDTTVLRRPRLRQ